MSKRYTVTWTCVIDEAEGPIDAAHEAQTIWLTDPHANLFVVTDEDGNSQTVEV